MKILNLIFDIGGVIVFQPKFDWLLEDRRLSLEEGTIKKIFDNCFSKRAIDKDFNEMMYFEKNYPNILSWDNYQKILSEFFASEKVNTDLVKWVENKKTCGYRIYALTNNTVVLNKLLKNKFEISHIFDRIFNSSEIGSAKPDPELFRYLLRGVNAEPEQCLFVDDNQRNVEAAAQLGFVSVLFEGNQDFLNKVTILKI